MPIRTSHTHGRATVAYARSCTRLVRTGLNVVGYQVVRTTLIVITYNVTWISKSE